jgi:hypothetical protein
MLSRTDLPREKRRRGIRANLRIAAMACPAIMAMAMIAVTATEDSPRRGEYRRMDHCRTRLPRGRAEHHARLGDRYRPLE